MNYNEQELAKFNELARELLEPFPESEISVNNQGFRYIDPERYRTRLLKAFPNGYYFHMEECVVGKTAVTGYGHFIGTLELQSGEKITYDLRPFCMEKFQVAQGTTDTTQKEDLSMKMLASALLKAASTEMGLGLHLYAKEVKRNGQVVSAATGTAGAAAPASGGGYAAPVAADGSWDGSAPIPINMKDKSGASMKGRPYSELDDKQVEFMATKDRPDQGAIKERARRAALANGAVAHAAATAAPPSTASDLDSEIPF